MLEGFSPSFEGNGLAASIWSIKSGAGAGAGGGAGPGEALLISILSSKSSGSSSMRDMATSCQCRRFRKDAFKGMILESCVFSAPISHGKSRQALLYAKILILVCRCNFYLMMSIYRMYLVLTRSTCTCWMNITVHRSQFTARLQVALLLMSRPDPPSTTADQRFDPDLFANANENNVPC